MKDCIVPELKASTYAVGKVPAIKAQDRVIEKVQNRVIEIVLNDGVSMNIRNKRRGRWWRLECWLIKE